VATNYYNSIELEWKPGGISDVLYYNIKYREYKKKGIDTEILSSDYDESNIDTNHRIQENIYNNENDASMSYDNENETNDIDSDSDYSGEQIDNENNNKFISINTTNTRFKVDNTLKPYTFYEFKVSAVNMLGKSDETNTIRVRTAATSKL
jgi:hypothetical protein